MKKAIFAIVAFVVSMSAMAGAPTSVKDSTGTFTYGTEAILRINKDTSSGNRVAVLFIGGATAYVDDNASWSVFAKLSAGLSLPVVAPTATNGLTYDAAKVRKVSCSGGNTVVDWPQNYNSDTLADSCSLFNAVKAASQ